MNFIQKRTGLDKREFDKLFLLILHSFFSAIFVSIFFSVANAEFVASFGSKFLPIGYLLSGVVGYISIRGYQRLLRTGGYRAFLGGLLFLLGCTILFRLILFFTDTESGKWMSFVIFLFAMPFLSISGLEQSGLLLKVYNIRDGKKYAGIINSGATVASIVGYLSIPLLIPFLGSRFDLLYVAIIGMTIAIYFLVRINKTLNLEEQKPLSIAETQSPSDISLRNLMRQKYIRYITISGGISMVAFYFVDYSFLLNAKASANSASELVAIIGAFFSFIKSAEFILSLMSGKIFRVFGLKVGIIILPAVCVSLTAMAILVHFFANAATFVAIIFALKFFERIVSKSIEEPTFKNLYQLLNTKDRLAIQAKIDGGTRQLFIIAGSLILLTYSSFMPAKMIQIGLLYISLPVFLIWLFSSRQLLASFKEKLRDLLRSGVTSNQILKNPLQRLLSSLQDHHNDKKQAKITLTTGEEIGYTDKYHTFVPAPALKDLVSDTGHARLKIQIDRPLVILPALFLHDLALREQSGALDKLQLLDLVKNDISLTGADVKIFCKKIESAKTNSEKKLILDVLVNSGDPYVNEFLIHQLDYPDYDLKQMAFDALEKREFKYAAVQEFYFRTSIETILSQITYFISAIEAIPLEPEFTDLKEALTEEENNLKNRLLSVLTWKYDRSSIMVIRENIFPSKKTEYVNNILALELIDNLIDREIKDQVMPVFESGAYAARLSTMNKWYHFPFLDTDQCLESILHHDYTHMSTWTKACALKVLSGKKSTEHAKLIRGFLFHPHPFLQNLSNESFEANHESDAGFKPNRTKIRLNGDQTFHLVKYLKHNKFFAKVPVNNLLAFCLHFEQKRSLDLMELVSIEKQRNFLYFTVKGNTVYEFNKIFPDALVGGEVILPDVFGDNKLRKILLSKDSSFFQVSRTEFTEFFISSNQLMNTVLTESWESFFTMNSAPPSEAFSS
jgi:hypothetical protein